MGCACMNEPGQEDAHNKNNHILANRNSNHCNNNIYHNERQRRLVNNNHNNHNNAEVNDYHQRFIEPYLQLLNDPDFNFKEIDDKNTGEGLKKMKGYISPISKEDLIRKRKAFWETRIEGNKETWLFLRQICEDPDFQHEDIREYLTATGITPYKNCLNVTYDTFGGLYEIPNYCIHEPLEYDLPEDHKTQPGEAMIKIKIRKGAEMIVIKVSNYVSVLQLKEEICNRLPNMKDKVNVGNIVLFYSGKEMKNDKQIWVYNVSDDSIVLLMIKN